MTTILVTGSNRGIGLEFVRQYATDGDEVIATCRNPNEADDLQPIAEASHGRVLIEQLDVSDPESIKALAQKYEGKPIDILINNAGVIGPRDPNRERLKEQFFGTLNYDAWIDVMKVNTLGPISCDRSLYRESCGG